MEFEVYGGKKGNSLKTFFKKVEELRTARHLTQDELLDSGIDLFESRACAFYRALRSSVTSWDELAKQFREEFHPVDYNERLYEKIKRKTQGVNSRIHLAVMEGFFRRLSYSLSVAVKLKILIRNMLPYYQQQLALTDLISIAHLRSLCKKLEEKHQIIDNFSGPSRKLNNLLEPDLAYVSTSAEVADIWVDAVSSEVVCIRSNKPGHLTRGCVLKSNNVCFRCRKVGYTLRTCPDCKSSGNASQRR